MRILVVSNKVKSFAPIFANEISVLHELNHEVIWAADFSHCPKSELDKFPCKTYNIAINTNPLKLTNVNALISICKIIKMEKITAVSCSTPIGGMLARIAAWIMRVKPVVYEAHGFLFFDGAPFINNTVYKLEEIILSRITDTLITITDEDYQAAQNFKLRELDSIYKVHGAGIKTGVEVKTSKIDKRKSLDIDEDSYVIVSAGELNKNKNNEVVIKAISKINNPKICYLICGEGEESKHLKELVYELSLENQVRFLGYRMDVFEIFAASDLFIMPSFREGVPRSLLEAMDLGLPCIGSNIRGIKDLIVEEKGGYLCNPKDYNSIIVAINNLIKNDSLSMQMGNFNRLRVNDYSIEVVHDELKDIYKKAFAS